ncbi:MAG TPA: hypothetical protein VNQ76_20370 [Planctomicrobium sp.]|nr:hypothetical protein [Planctomicrobium sp.]
MTTLKQIEAFHEFASEQVRKGETTWTLGELVDLWELQNLTADEFSENVAAIQEAIDDLQNGETGRPAMELVRELRGQLNLSRDK